MENPSRTIKTFNLSYSRKPLWLSMPRPLRAVFGEAITVKLDAYWYKYLDLLILNINRIFNHNLNRHYVLYLASLILWQTLTMNACSGSQKAAIIDSLQNSQGQVGWITDHTYRVEANGQPSRGETMQTKRKIQAKFAALAEAQEQMKTEFVRLRMDEQNANNADYYGQQETEESLNSQAGGTEREVKGSSDEKNRENQAIVREEIEVYYGTFIESGLVVSLKFDPKTQDCKIIYELTYKNLRRKVIKGEPL